jgi:hypothetical protein
MSEAEEKRILDLRLNQNGESGPDSVIGGETDGRQNGGKKISEI